MEKLRRGLNNDEWDNFKDSVKCPWQECAGVMGLIGNGHCSFAGDWQDPNCPRFELDEEFRKGPK